MYDNEKIIACPACKKLMKKVYVASAGMNVDICVDDNCYEYQVLSMLCQPIIENSIIHGLDEKLINNEEAKIEIRVTNEEEFLCINVYDNGKGINESKINSLLSEKNIEDIALKDIPRVRFMTSHPWDFNDKMIEVIAKYPNIMPSVHLPVQSGSSRILKLMGRRYTRES